MTFLQLPVRPKVVALDDLTLQAHYTCSFDAFLLYELRYQAQQPKPDWNTVNQLDILVFSESDMPQTWGLRQAFTNLDLLMAITKISIPGNPLRDKQNRLLLKIEEAIRARGQNTLRGVASTKALAYKLLKETQQLNQQKEEIQKQQLMRGLDQQPGSLPANGDAGDITHYFATYVTGEDNATYTVAMDDALYELALETARSGNIADAFALADSISATTTYALSQMKYAPKIRIAEQAMLTNGRRVQPALDNFLSDYLSNVQAGVMPTGADESENISPSASALAVCFWRPFIAKGQLDTIPIIARSLTYRLNKLPLTIGLKAPFKAYGLADEVYEANEELVKSPFVLGFSRFVLINQTLLGYAHFLNPARDSGWYEYDEAELTLPAEYISFNG